MKIWIREKKSVIHILTSKGFLSGSWKNRNSSRGSARGGPIHLHRSPFLCLSCWQELRRRQGIPWKLLPGPESARRLPQRSPAPGVSQWSPKPYRLLTTGVINNPLYENVTFQEKPWVYSIINWSFFLLNWLHLYKPIKSNPLFLSGTVIIKDRSMDYWSILYWWIFLLLSVGVSNDFLCLSFHWCTYLALILILEMYVDQLPE